MATVILGDDLRLDIDPTLSKQFVSFVTKVQTDHTTPGLHVEPMKNAVDRRARTARLNQKFRVVMFELTQGSATSFVIHGVYNHDDAIDIARTSELRVNPLNGVPEIITHTAPTEAEVQGRLAAGQARDEALRRQELAATLPARTEEVAEDGDTRQTPGPSSENLGTKATADHNKQPVAPMPAPHIRYAADEIADNLGLRRPLAEAAVACSTEDELLLLAQQARGWEQDVILELGAGSTIEKIRDELDLLPPDEAKKLDSSDDTIIERLHAPSSKARFAFVTTQDEGELYDIVHNQSFTRWRVFLHPSQRKLVEQRANGPMRITGGAGTGKTVVLVHRARELARRYPGHRILLTTFTKNLADMMRQQLRSLDSDIPLARKFGDPGVCVSSIDALVAEAGRRAGSEHSRYVAEIKGTGYQAKVSPGDQRWAEAATYEADGLTAETKSARFLADEYAYVVLPNEVTSQKEYLRVKRVGRGTPLSRRQRIAVWGLIERYHMISSMHGQIDFGEAQMIGAKYLDDLAEQSGVRMCDHILIDEAQDLTPAHWRFLRATVADGPDNITIAQDMRQRIYGQKVTLSHFGIDVRGRARNLKLNYRTTAQNLAYGVAILKGHTFDEDMSEAELIGDRSAMRGPYPVVLQANSFQHEIEFVAQKIKEWIEAKVEPDSIGVLVRENQFKDRVIAALNDAGVPVRALGPQSTSTGHPWVLTMHRSKGTEFRCVVVMGASAKSLPARSRYSRQPEAERSDAELRERALLYVASTRARDELVVTYHGDPSELLPGTTQ